MDQPIVSGGSVVNGHSRNNTPNVDRDNNEGCFCRYVITPVKDAVSCIVEGICTLCRNIRSFFIRVCSPCCGGFAEREQLSPETDQEGIASLNQAEPVLDGDRVVPEVLFDEDAGKTDMGLVMPHDASPPRAILYSDSEGMVEKQSTGMAHMNKSQSMAALFQEELVTDSRDPMTESGVTSVGTGLAAATAEPSESSSPDKSSTSGSYLSVGSQVYDQEQESSQSDSEPFLDFDKTDVYIPSTNIVPTDAMLERELEDATLLPLEESTTSEGALMDAGVTPGYKPESKELSELEKNQSVFTAPHFSSSHYDGIKEFLRNNPDLKGNFPRFREVKGKVQYQWKDLDFSEADLQVRDVGYNKREKKPKKRAGQSIFPLVGVDLFSNALGGSDLVVVSRCPNSFSYEWIRRNNAPDILVKNMLLPDMNLVLYYAVPKGCPVEDNCQPFLKQLSSRDETIFKEAIKKVKIIPHVVKVGALPRFLSGFMKTPAVAVNRFNVHGYLGRSKDGENHYNECCIDIRSSRVLWYSFNSIKSAATLLHLHMGFSREPLAVDERAALIKKSGNEIDDHLPEHIYGGVEMLEPDISQGLTALQLPLVAS